MDELLRGQAEKLWREYADLVFEGVAIDQVQHDETCKAFYAGMLACLNFVAGPDVTGRSDEDGCAVLDAFEGELFAKCRSFLPPSPDAGGEPPGVRLPPRRPPPPRGGRGGGGERERRRKRR